MSSREILVLLILLIVLGGSLPYFPHSRNWGYRPSGLITLLLIVLIVTLIF
jgi:Protein of unknown function (DUF3309)